MDSTGEMPIHGKGRAGKAFALAVQIQHTAVKNHISNLPRITSTDAVAVIADMAHAGFESVTMIQRSKTWLMPSSTFEALVDPVFNYETPLSLSDRMLLGYPLPVQRLLGKAGIEMCADARPDYFERMEAQGWDIERNGDLWVK